MLRAFMIYLSKLSWAQKLITGWRFAWRAASRFIAGETSSDALEVVRKLNEEGIIATVDFLGEHTSTPEEARQAADEVTRVLGEIEDAGLKSNVSVKLSQMGLVLDQELCKENLKKILLRARECNNFVRIDMEDSTLTEKTVNMYRWARQAGFENVGIVFQSYLFRTQDDLHSLAELGVKVRLCKGAYKEPPEVAFQKKSEVNENLDACTLILFDAVQKSRYPAISKDGRFPPIPAIASHDEKRIDFAQEHARMMGLPPETVEFQMLLGIRRDLQTRLAAEGHPVRVYVPYGTHWYPYFMRRLAERPANLWFFISNFFHR